MARLRAWWVAVWSAALAAVQFLTTLPPLLRRPFTPREIGRAMGFYPLVGALLGLWLVGLDALLAPLFPAGVVPALLLLFSGVYFPISVLPEWMQPVARLSPATYVLEGMRAALLDGVGLGTLGGYLLRLVLIGLLAIPVGLAVFRQAEKYAKRTGKLNRCG